jgi:predicted dehydrogenase
MQEGNRINFAIIGCGRISKRHAEHISNQGNLVAVCDVVLERAEELGKAFNARYYTNVEKMLEEEAGKVDVVTVCSPNGLHAEHSINSLNAGYHVICEKPLAINVHDCGEMIKVSERVNKQLFVVKQNRYNPPIIAVKNLIDEGRLGKIFSIQLSCFWNRNEDYYKNSWKGTKDLDGGTLYTQFSHFIDILYWMFGDVKSVNGISGNFAHKDIIEFEDCGVVILEFHSGAIGTINYSVNSYGQNMEGSLTVFGEKGTVKVGGQYLNELEYQNIEGEKVDNLPAGNTANNYGKYQGSMSNHGQVYENVIGVLSNHEKMTTVAFEGLKTVEIIDKIYNAFESK